MLDQEAQARGQVRRAHRGLRPHRGALQLLAFPDVAKWYLDRIFPIHRMMNKVARPMMQPFISIPLPSDEIFSNVKDLLLDLEG